MIYFNPKFYLPVGAEDWFWEPCFVFPHVEMCDHVSSYPGNRENTKQNTDDIRDLNKIFYISAVTNQPDRIQRWRGLPAHVARAWITDLELQLLLYISW